MGLGSFFGGVLGGVASRLGLSSGVEPRPVSPDEAARVLGPPPPHPLMRSDAVLSDIWSQPYRGPLDLDRYGQETPEMRHRYRTEYRTSPVLRAAVRGKADDLSTLEPMVLPQDPSNPVEKAAAEFVHWTVSQCPRGWRGVIDTVYTPGSLDGYSLSEIVLDVVRWKGRAVWGLRHLQGKDSAFIRLQLDQYRNVLSVVNFVRGIEYIDPAKCVLYSHNPLYSNPFGQSDLRATTRAAALIEDAYKVWYVALEVYGLPYMVAHGKPTNRKALGEALEAIRKGGWAVTELDESIEVLNLAAAAGTDAFEKMVQVQREDIFYAVRGAALPFLQGQGSGDSRGSSKVEQGSSDAGERASAMDVADAIRRQLFPALVYPNFGEIDLPSLRLGGTNWEETAKVLSMVKDAQAVGLKLSKKQVHMISNLAPPEDPADELKPPQQPGAGGGPGGGLAGMLGGGGGEKPPAAPAPAPAPKPPATFADSVVWLPTGRLAADPGRFQFRRGHDADDGTVRDLPADRFDPRKCPPLAAWNDPADGRDYVVDGHHRLAWAERDGVPRVPVKFVPAKTAAEAKRLGEDLNRTEHAPPAPPATFSDAHHPPAAGPTPEQVARVLDDLIREYGGAA